MSRIYRQSEEEMSPMGEDRYIDENNLQNRISEYPNLLAGDQMGESKNKSWLLVAREYNIPDNRESGGTWSIDHLFLDEDGIPTFVEVKRWEDPRVRREVVGQMLDYVSQAVVHESVVNLQESLRKQYGEATADEHVSDLITGSDELSSVRDFWRSVKKNLEARMVRMLFVADKIPPELKSIIEFLNEQMKNPEVLGVEIQRYSKGDEYIFVPSILGDTAKSSRSTMGELGDQLHLENVIESDNTDISVGDTLYASIHDKDFTAKITENGRLKFQGDIHSPTSAANEASEQAGGTRQRSGNRVWKKSDGTKIGDIDVSE